jgi:hypothetical protein
LLALKKQVTDKGNIFMPQNVQVSADNVQEENREDQKEKKESSEISQPTFKLIKIFEKLVNINSPNPISSLKLEEKNSWATGYGINKTMIELLGDSVYFVNPDLASVESLASSDEEEALMGTVNYIKIIRGFYINDEFRDGFIKGENGVLDKPIVMILNTTSVKVENPRSSKYEGGNHWQTCVILPKNYITPFGENIENTNEIVFFVDSKYKNKPVPVLLEYVLRYGFEYKFQSAEGVNYIHLVPPSMPNAEFPDCTNILQQEGGADCGWWAVYNALMFVFTGKRDFLNQFTQRSREPGYALRMLFNNLSIPFVGEKQQKKAFDKQNQKAIYDAIKNALKENKITIPLFNTAKQHYVGDISDKRGAIKAKEKIKRQDLECLIKMRDLLENLKKKCDIRLVSNINNNQNAMKKGTEIVIVRKAKGKRDVTFQIKFNNKKAVCNKELSGFLASLNFCNDILDRNKHQKIYELVYHIIVLKGDCIETDEINVQILHQIVSLCGGEKGLAFNDKYDPDTYFIRNRYGYKKRNEENKENDDVAGRVDFEALFRVKALIDAEVGLPSELIVDLSILKKKLEYIVYKEYQEDTLILGEKYNHNFQGMNTPLGDVGNMEIVRNFVIQEYPKLIFKKFKLEVEEVCSIKLIDKPSTYIFSRKFVVMGELLHELSEIIPGIKKEKKDNLFSLFGRFNGFRNGFIHLNFHVILFSLLTEEMSKLVKEAITPLFENLPSLCNKSKSLVDEVEDINALKLCRKSLDDLLGLMQASKKRKVRKNLLEIVLLANHLFEILDSKVYKDFKDFLRKNWEVFSSLGKVAEIISMGLKHDSPSQFLALESYEIEIDKTIKESFKNFLKNLKTFILERDLQNFKREYLLLLEEQDSQLFVSEKFNSTVIPGFKIENINFEDKDSIEETLTLHKEFSKESGSETAKNFSIFFNKLHQSLKKHKITTPNLISISKRYQDAKARLSELELNDKIELEKEFNFSICLEDVKKIQELLKQSSFFNPSTNPVKKFTGMITREMDYLSEIELHPTLFMKNCIVEHIVTLIGQYVRDIEDRTLDSEVFISYTSRVAGKTAKMSRSKGLAHELFNFSQENFLRDLLADIYPAVEDFKAIYLIADSKSETVMRKSSLIYAKLGWSYAQLSFLEEAIDFYEKALESFSKDGFNESFCQSELDRLGITRSAVLIDFNKFVFGISNFELYCYRNLQHLYLRVDNLEKVDEIFYLFLKKFDLKLAKKYQEMLSQMPDAGDEDKKNMLSSMDSKLSKSFISLIESLKSQERPSAIIVDEKCLFESLSDILAGAACVKRRKGDYKTAINFLSQSIEFIVVKMKKRAKTALIEMQSFSTEKLMDYYFELAQCYQKMDQPTDAITFANIVLKEGSLGARLTARSVIYFAKCKLGTIIDSDLEEYNTEVSKNLHLLKKNYGDGFFDYLEQLYRVQLDYYLYKGELKGMQIFLEKLEEEFFTQYHMNLYKRLDGLRCSIFDSCINALNPSLQKGVYEKMLDIAKKHFKFLETEMATVTPNLNYLAQKLAIAINNYAEFYFSIDTIQENTLILISHKISNLVEALGMEEIYHIDVNVILMNICASYNKKAEYCLLYRKENLLAEEAFLECIRYADRIDIKRLSSDELIILYNQYAYYFEQLATIHRSDKNRALQSYSNALFYAKKSLSLGESQYNATIYNKGMFFSQSLHATEKMPYGPYSDRLCSQYDPLTIATQQYSRLSKLKASV